MTGFQSTLLVTALLGLAGCQPTAQSPTVTATAAAPAPVATADAPNARPAVQPAAKPDRPRLVLQTFAGEQYDLKAHRGKWVVVNFWATWCNPCLKEIPDLDAFDRARPDVEVIGLAYEEIERADMEAFLKVHRIGYPIALLDVYDPPADFDTPNGLPMTYLIAPDGLVARKFLGPVTSAELAKMIESPVPPKAS